ncbi:hypothetical protein AWC38_SpisGene7250 [Stylophora pistillata]|uniref:HTH CENPB-type domain-containing protein n=1 Tax=Stylophora pistillata TaxID=50429 RepID=A0A2B4SF72_STYPI|nr:hypothetical protein AWC38_SpisGene7250 [Stylophora pistillata]
MGCFTPKYPEVDQRLLEWFSEQRSQGIAVGGLMLRLKAKEFYYDPALKASVGWYINWKPSHSFTLRTKDHPRPASAKRSRRANSKIPPDDAIYEEEQDNDAEDDEMEEEFDTESEDEP